MHRLSFRIESLPWAARDDKTMWLIDFLRISGSLWWRSPLIVTRLAYNEKAFETTKSIEELLGWTKK